MDELVKASFEKGAGFFMLFVFRRNPPLALTCALL
jgi:hypothetical protein